MTKYACVELQGQTTGTTFCAFKRSKGRTNVKISHKTKIATANAFKCHIVQHYCFHDRTGSHTIIQPGWTIMFTETFCGTLFCQEKPLFQLSMGRSVDIKDAILRPKHFRPVSVNIRYEVVSLSRPTSLSES